MGTKLYLHVLFFFLCCGTTIYGQFDPDKKAVDKHEGFFDFYHDKETGKIFMKVKELDKDFLYINALSSGIGSNDIGLDRGQLGSEQLVRFKKMDNKLFLVQPNLQYRAITSNTLERKAVEQAFAQSFLAAFKIEKQEGGSFIIDITNFLMQDAHGVGQRLQRTGQGSYKLDKSLSAINSERTKAFPKNVEFDLYLTFTGTPKGGLIRSVSPNASQVTVAQHHSFVALPDAGFEQRAFDPRSGSYPFTYADYASPVHESIERRFIPRHRLQKKNPNAAVSEAVEPIVYYLDNGTPEPVRSALLEGGRWWNQAFEAIGYKDAFQLKMLPVDADPLDVRYNVIQWVHRSTRGWSYGNSVVDPRTGEIIKGHVSLGSLRIRQDFMIAQALMNTPFASSDSNNQPMLEMALARIRQLSAHEIGHTLGFAHNFAASTNNRASVMDYPHPNFKISGNEIDFSNAYDTGIGAWDKVSVGYAYSDFPEGTDETTALNEILNNAHKQGLRYISDQDARPAGSAHAYGHLWDNGGDASTELQRVLQLRKKAIEQFSSDNIRNNEAYSTLEDVFVPLYFFHRYQTEAAAKVIGGMEYTYAVKGGEETPWRLVDRNEQEDALSAVLTTLNAENIAIPKEKLSLFPPRAIGFRAGRESFKGRTGVSFDPLGAVETAADMSLSFLLHPDRASRLVVQKSLDPKQLSLEEVIDQLINQTLKLEPKDDYHKAAQEVVNFRVLYHIMALAANTEVHPQVNAIARTQLNKIVMDRIGKGFGKAMQDEYLRRINFFNEHPEQFKVPSVPKIPDGSPIGMDCFH